MSIQFCFICQHKENKDSGINFFFCQSCIKNNVSLAKLYKEVPLGEILKQIGLFAATNNYKIEERSYIFTDELIEYLQQ